MTALLIKILESNPIIFYGVLLAVIVLIFVVLLIAIKKGYSIVSPILKLEKKDAVSKKMETGSIQQNTQVQTIQILPGEPMALTEEKIENIARRVAEIKGDQKSNLLEKYLFPPLDERIAYLFSAPLGIREKLAKIVLGWGGGWAGCSINPIENYLTLAKAHKLIGNDLYDEITEFLSYVSIYYYSSFIPDQDYLKLQYLSADINIKLENQFNSLKENGTLKMIDPDI